MPDQFNKPMTQAEEIRDLKLRNYALLALIAALPSTADINVDRARAALDSIIDPADDILDNDQVARAMHFIQVVLADARSQTSP